MNISDENKQILTFLSGWQSDDYNFYKIHDLDFSDRFSLFEDIDGIVGDDLPEDIEDEFYDFADTSCGGSFCLWFYPELKGEPPVVFAGMEGERSTVASSFKEFSFLLTQKKVLDATSLDYESDGTESPWTDFKDSYDSNELGLESKEMTEAIAEFTKQLSEVADMENIPQVSDHPNFAKWIDNLKDW